MTSAFKELFEQLHEAEDQIDTAVEAVAVAEAAGKKVRAAIWKAIDEAIAASADHEDLHEAIRRLETQVLELTNRLPPTNGT